MNRLVARDVTVITGNRTRVIDVDLDVPAGHIHAIIGPNGSGKSTLMAALAGEIALARGSVLIDGLGLADLRSAPAARKRAVLDQEVPMPFAFTVAEVVSWGRLAWRRTEARHEDEEVLREVIQQQGLTGLLRRPVPTLSAGERARVHLARVLAQRAPLLFLDEPDSALDLAGRDHLAFALRACRDRGDSVVLVGHDLNWLLGIADSFTVLRAGRVVAQGNGALTADVVSAAFGVNARQVDVPGRRLLYTD